jgi:2-polyprenyl-3-methyl-5-hydroxy-6-metoxy-1,4-benzoquinol methylase
MPRTVAISPPGGEICPVCGGANFCTSRFVVEQRFALYHCATCGLGLLDISGTDDDGFDEYWDAINQRVYADPAVIGELSAKYERYFRLLRSAVPNKRFLDVGSGAGISIGTAARLGFEAIGVEPSANAVALSRRQYQVPVVHGLLRADDDLPRDFGMLALWDVIEHVADPETLLRICHQHMADGGVLLLETPDEGTLLRAIIRVVGAMAVLGFDPRRNIYYRAHRYYFTRQAMTRLLQRCGFGSVRFFAERTMYEKEQLKKRMYGDLSRVKEFGLRSAFLLFKHLPFLANKMVVAAVKTPAV